MPLTPAAINEHDRLFPHHVSTLGTTDPELVEFFGNFAFDEIVRESALERPDRLLYQVGACIAVGAQTEFRILVGAALTSGVTPVEIKEVAYQAVAYVGLARVIDFVHIINEVLAAHGIALPLPRQATSGPENRMEVGKAVQESIVGPGRVDAMYESSAPDTLHFQRFLTGNCFGDIVGRDGIDLQRCELLTFTLIASLGGADPQVKGHVKNNLIVGNTRADLIAVLTVLVPFIGYPRTLNALAAINENAPFETA